MWQVAVGEKGTILAPTCRNLPHAYLQHVTEANSQSVEQVTMVLELLDNLKFLSQTIAFLINLLSIDCAVPLHQAHVNAGSCLSVGGGSFIVHQE